MQGALPQTNGAASLLGKLFMLSGNVGWGVKQMHTPSSWTFWLSVILVVLAIIATFVHIPVISQYAFWVAVLGYVVLVFGCLVKTT
jgi:hypothetical protein